MKRQKTINLSKKTVLTELCASRNPKDKNKPIRKKFKMKKSDLQKSLYQRNSKNTLISKSKLHTLTDSSLSKP